MMQTRTLGPVCFVSNWFGMDAGTLALGRSPLPGPQVGMLDVPPATTGVRGKIDGLGTDIVDYLREVGTFFGVMIHVTSGLRDSDAQAQAMFDNWIKLERGKVYAKSAVPDKRREEMDEYYKTAKENAKATPAEKQAARDQFLALGKLTPSRHSGGRAADIALGSINPHAHKAILMRMQEIKEGSRKDIIHVQSDQLIPAVDQALRHKWEALRDGVQHKVKVGACSAGHGASCQE